MAAALFIWVAVAFMASATSKAAAVTNPDSTIVIKSKGIYSTFRSKDTLFVPEAPESHQPFYSNLSFKQRLDSVEHAVPLNYNSHVQKYIDIYLSRKEEMGKILGLSKYYFPIFEKNLKEVGIPEEIKFISIIESALNPNAISKSGAVGPWQFMYTTAKGYGLTMNNYVDERKDPVQASYAAALYFKDAYSKLGDWLLAIAAYNCGTGAVTRAVARAGGHANFWEIRSFLPKETQNYVPAFIATAYVMNYYMKHDIYPAATDFNILTDIIEVDKIISLASIAKAGDLNLKELNILNPCYKKQIINGTANSPKRLVIPAVDKLAYTSLYNLLNPAEPQIVQANYKEEVILSSSAYHEVGADESLLLIANRYGVEVQDLIVWNNLKSEILVPGQSLRVASVKKQNNTYIQKSSSKYFTYRVRMGDTLSRIADKFAGVTVSAIKSVNGLRKSTVKPGMLLRIMKG